MPAGEVTNSPPSMKGHGMSLASGFKTPDPKGKLGCTPSPVSQLGCTPPPPVLHLGSPARPSTSSLFLAVPSAPVSEPAKVSQKFPVHPSSYASYTRVFYVAAAILGSVCFSSAVAVAVWGREGVMLGIEHTITVLSSAKVSFVKEFYLFLEFQVIPLYQAVLASPLLPTALIVVGVSATLIIGVVVWRNVKSRRAMLETIQELPSPAKQVTHAVVLPELPEERTLGATCKRLSFVAVGILGTVGTVGGFAVAIWGKEGVILALEHAVTVLSSAKVHLVRSLYLFVELQLIPSYHAILASPLLPTALAVGGVATALLLGIVIWRKLKARHVVEEIIPEIPSPEKTGGLSVLSSPLRAMTRKDSNLKQLWDEWGRVVSAIDINSRDEASKQAFLELKSVFKQLQTYVSNTPVLRDKPSAVLILIEPDFKALEQAYVLRNLLDAARENIKELKSTDLDKIRADIKKLTFSGPFVPLQIRTKLITLFKEIEALRLDYWAKQFENRVNELRNPFYSELDYVDLKNINLEQIVANIKKIQTDPLFQHASDLSKSALEEMTSEIALLQAYKDEIPAIEEILEEIQESQKQLDRTRQKIRERLKNLGEIEEKSRNKNVLCRLNLERAQIVKAITAFDLQSFACIQSLQKQCIEVCEVIDANKVKLRPFGDDPLFFVHQAVKVAAELEKVNKLHEELIEEAGQSKLVKQARRYVADVLRVISTPEKLKAGTSASKGVRKVDVTLFFIKKEESDETYLARSSEKLAILLGNILLQPFNETSPKEIAELPAILKNIRHSGCWSKIISNPHARYLIDQFYEKSLVKPFEQLEAAFTYLSEGEGRDKELLTIEELLRDIEKIHGYDAFAYVCQRMFNKYLNLLQKGTPDVIIPKISLLQVIARMQAEVTAAKTQAEVKEKSAARAGSNDQELQVAESRMSDAASGWQKQLKNVEVGLLQSLWQNCLGDVRDCSNVRVRAQYKEEFQEKLEAYWKTEFTGLMQLRAFIFVWKKNEKEMSAKIDPETMNRLKDIVPIIEKIVKKQMDWIFLLSQLVFQKNVIDFQMEFVQKTKSTFNEAYESVLTELEGEIGYRKKVMAAGKDQQTEKELPDPMEQFIKTFSCKEYQECIQEVAPMLLVRDKISRIVPGLDNQAYLSMFWNFLKGQEEDPKKDKGGLDSYLKRKLGADFFTITSPPFNGAMKRKELIKEAIKSKFFTSTDEQNAQLNEFFAYGAAALELSVKLTKIGEGFQFKPRQTKSA
ncbi:MAG: hypothetical protein H0X51_04345 [Parachlamydiaceae bacterium]|nr:hypothetical protein [Parachlamydiaceae bacterium]